MTALQIENSRSGKSEVIILVKAVPHVSKKHGETVCCAGISPEGNWLRLYPVAFRSLERGKKFGRWDKIEFKWQLPRDDIRPESRRVDEDSVHIIGELKKSERSAFLSGKIVTSLKREREAKRSLALLSIEVLDFHAEKRSEAEISEEASTFKSYRSQTDLFSDGSVIPFNPCPYNFKYRYRMDDGEREGTCMDWEIAATFFNWRLQYSEQDTLNRIQKRFGEEYPKKGMLLAMGTHSLFPERWLINGIVRVNQSTQGTLF